MKKIIILFALLISLGACDKIQNLTKKETTLKTDEEKFSYLVGVNTAESLKAIPLDINQECLIRGLQDALSKKDLALNDKEIEEVKQNISKKLESAQKERNAKLIEENLKKSNDFLAENKKKEGVTETASGLQYEVITQGQGEKPTAKNTVKVHYRGTTIDGKEFDSSYKRNEPIEFPLEGVIKGWTEGLQLMNKGSKFKFYIKPDLAYGEHGVPGIEPNSLLIFEVELLDFK